jgi:hypothetical protein
MARYRHPAKSGVAVEGRSNPADGTVRGRRGRPAVTARRDRAGHRPGENAAVPADSTRGSRRPRHLPGGRLPAGQDRRTRGDHARGRAPRWRPLSRRDASGRTAGQNARPVRTHGRSGQRAQPVRTDGRSGQRARKSGRRRHHAARLFPSRPGRSAVPGIIRSRPCGPRRSGPPVVAPWPVRRRDRRRPAATNGVPGDTSEERASDRCTGTWPATSHTPGFRARGSPAGAGSVHRRTGTRPQPQWPQPPGLPACHAGSPTPSAHRAIYEPLDFRPYPTATTPDSL